MKSSSSFFSARWKKEKDGPSHFIVIRNPASSSSWWNVSPGITHAQRWKHGWQQRHVRLHHRHSLSRQEDTKRVTHTLPIKVWAKTCFLFSVRRSWVGHCCLFSCFVSLPSGYGIPSIIQLYRHTCYYQCIQLRWKPQTTRDREEFQEKQALVFLWNCALCFFFFLKNKDLYSIMTYFVRGRYKAVFWISISRESFQLGKKKMKQAGPEGTCVPQRFR